MPIAKWRHLVAFLENWNAPLFDSKQNLVFKETCSRNYLQPVVIEEKLSKMDSDDEQDEQTYTWRGVPGTIVVINVFDSSRETAAVALAATCRMVRQHLRTSSSQLIGVCLYGTEDMQDTNSAFGTKSVVEVIPLTTPTLDDFKKLRGTQISAFAPAKEFKISDVLWHCSKMFTNCKKLLSSRSVIMLTRLDKSPIESDQKPTLKRVVDLVDTNVDIKIINISQDEYKVDLFYEKFLIEANKGKDFIPPAPVFDEKEIDKLMHQQSHRHLAVARLRLDIGDDVSIGVGVYNLLVRSMYNKKFSLERNTNAVITSVTKTVKLATDATPEDVTRMEVDNHDQQQQQKVPLLKLETLHYQVYGEERVEFTSDEMTKLRNPFGQPKMKLLGFKPSSLMCKEKWYLKSGYFLFPNEGFVEGSTVAFKAMHQACVETGMVAICVLNARVNAKPAIVALSPCTHPLGLDVEIGFDVIRIPFMENVRDLPPVDEDETNVTEQQKTLMKEILQKLQFNYSPDMFENPKIQSEYRVVEAKALDDEDLDPFVDTTIAPPEKFEGLQEDLFEELFGPFEMVAPKRPAPLRENGTSAKRVRGEEINDAFVQESIRFKRVHQFTVAQLKEILKNSGSSRLPSMTGLKKNELVDLVYELCKA